jgi:hypothetical protein
VGFFRSSFNLSIPVDIDLAVNIVYPEDHGAFRSQVWINGWMMGKRVGDLGPQLEVRRKCETKWLKQLIHNLLS